MILQQQTVDVKEDVTETVDATTETHGDYLAEITAAAALSGFSF